MVDPRPDQVAHPCPVCGLFPVIGTARYPRTVCDRCSSKTVCLHGRDVTGHNTSLLGAGFEAQHVDDGTVCDEVTGTGRCWIEGQECRMGEARFGGVFVEAVS